GSDTTCGDDAGNLKITVVEWVDTLYGPSVPQLKPGSKDERGLNNDSTGRLLCPSEHNWDDEIVHVKICDSDPEFTVTAGPWPMCMYAAQTRDPDDMEKGLFPSALLIKSFNNIITSPSSAVSVSVLNDLVNSENILPASKKAKRKGPTHSNIASLIGLKSVTPRTITYTAVQLRFALSNANS
ncbi:hypothetical protein FIBSPDRAFT_754335, partial [Athelia psychrophila]